jgi:hypothetical protein
VTFEYFRESILGKSCKNNLALINQKHNLFVLIFFCVAFAKYCHSIIMRFVNFQALKKKKLRI